MGGRGGEGGGEEKHKEWKGRGGESKKGKKKKEKTKKKREPRRYKGKKEEIVSFPQWLPDLAGRATKVPKMLVGTKKDLVASRQSSIPHHP